MINFSKFGSVSGVPLSKLLTTTEKKWLRKLVMDKTFGYIKTGNFNIVPEFYVNWKHSHFYNKRLNITKSSDFDDEPRFIIVYNYGIKYDGKKFDDGIKMHWEYWTHRQSIELPFWTLKNICRDEKLNKLV